MKSIFLMDSNAFIASARLHYPFNKKMFHPFWRNLEKLIKDGTILILDSVYAEIVPSNSLGDGDTLSNWMKVNCFDCRIPHTTDEIGTKYTDVQNYLVCALLKCMTCCSGTTTTWCMPPASTAYSSPTTG